MYSMLQTGMPQFFLTLGSESVNLLRILDLPNFTELGLYIVLPSTQFVGNQ